MVSELRRYTMISEKSGMKIIDFDDFVFCTTESKSITFHTGLFIEDYFSQRQKSHIWLILLPAGIFFACGKFKKISALLSVSFSLLYLPDRFQISHRFQRRMLQRARQRPSKGKMSSWLRFFQR